MTLDDEADTDLHVSQRAGKVMQCTIHFERAWNYVGAVAHWSYPNVLRKSWVAWDRTVWWLSLVGVVALQVARHARRRAASRLRGLGRVSGAVIAHEGRRGATGTHGASMSAILSPRASASPLQPQS